VAWGRYAAALARSTDSKILLVAHASRSLGRGSRYCAYPHLPPAFCSCLYSVGAGNGTDELGWEGEQKERQAAHFCGTRTRPVRASRRRLRGRRRRGVRAPATDCPHLGVARCAACSVRCMPRRTGVYYRAWPSTRGAPWPPPPPPRRGAGLWLPFSPPHHWGRAWRCWQQAPGHARQASAWLLESPRLLAGCNSPPAASYVTIAVMPPLISASTSPCSIM